MQKIMKRRNRIQLILAVILLICAILFSTLIMCLGAAKTHAAPRYDYELDLATLDLGEDMEGGFGLEDDGVRGYAVWGESRDALSLYLTGAEIKTYRLTGNTASNPHGTIRTIEIVHNAEIALENFFGDDVTINYLGEGVEEGAVISLFLNGENTVFCSREGYDTLRTGGYNINIYGSGYNSLNISSITNSAIAAGGGRVIINGANIVASTESDSEPAIYANWVDIVGDCLLKRQDSDGSDPFVADGAEVASFSPHGLKYISTVYKFTVKYNAGEFGEGEIDTVVTDYGSTVYINNTAQRFTREGYRQRGWATSDGGAKIYNLSDEYLGHDAIIELFPFWEMEDYTITFLVNDGIFSVGYIPPEEYNYGDALALPTAAQITRIGRTFSGWFLYDPEVGAYTDTEGNETDSLSSADSSYAFTGICSTDTGNKSFAAKWTIARYTLTWNAAGGSIPAGDYTFGSVEFGAPITAPANPTRAGYIFMGWDAAIAASMPANNVTYRAQWSSNVYSLTINYYFADTAISIAASYSSTVYYDGNYSVASPVVAGYTANYAVVSGAMNQEGKNVTVYYTQNTDTPYTVVHKKQNLAGEGYDVAERENLRGTTDTPAAAAAKSYEGFTAQAFVNTQIMGDGTSVIEILYQRNSYTLIWNAAGGNIPAGDYTFGSVVFGAPITAPANPVKMGYTFNGWGSEVAAAMPASDTAYTAQWTLNVPAITDSKGYEGKYDHKWHSIAFTVSHELENVTLTYQWYIGSISEENLLTGQTNATLSVKDISQSGTYYCRITYTDGKQSNYLDSEAIIVNIYKADLSWGAIVAIAAGGVAFSVVAAYTFLYIVWKKTGKVTLIFLKASFRKVNKLFFKTELSDIERLAERK